MARWNHAEERYQEMLCECAGCYKAGRYADHEHELGKQFNGWVVANKDIEERIFAPYFKKAYNLKVYGIVSDLFFTFRNGKGKIVSMFKGFLRRVKR